MSKTAGNADGWPGSDSNWARNNRKALARLGDSSFSLPAPLYCTVRDFTSSYQVPQDSDANPSVQCSGVWGKLVASHWDKATPHEGEILLATERVAHVKPNDCTTVRHNCQAAQSTVDIIPADLRLVKSVTSGVIRPTLHSVSSSPVECMTRE